MIQVKFDPAKLQEPLKAEWDQLQKKVEQATSDAIVAWEDWKDEWEKKRKAANPNLQESKNFEIKFREDIWSDLKKWLLNNIFYNKCAYCETSLRRSYGDAEHYRPKGRVKARPSFRPIDGVKTQAKGNAKFVMVQANDETGNLINHPGYFWLAYNWKNLLPSCDRCNTGEGKNDLFPVNQIHELIRKLTEDEVNKLKAQPYQSKKWKGFYYLQPEDLNAMEDPLLLHPYVDDPSVHLLFGDKGIVTSVKGSEKGAKSIEVYKLDTKALNDDRQVYQERIRTRYFGTLNNARGDPKKVKEKARKAINDFILGKEPYSAAALGYLKLFDVVINKDNGVHE
jgi:hypothetical protein